MHLWVLLPTLVNPLNKILEALFFLFRIVSPEVFKLSISLFIKICVAPKVLQAAFIKWIAFYIEEHI
ncbi:hypothetical protein BOV92_09050 [Solemya velum gill symbiont]|nr:hypothetical protein BOV92_09050 [Solemya velum gill symbiont]